MLYSPQQLNVYTVFLIQTSVSSRTSAVAYQIGIIADIVEFVNKLLLLFLAGIVQNYLQFFLVFQIFLLIYFWSYINVYKRNDRRRHCFPDQQFDQNSSRILRHLAFKTEIPTGEVEKYHQPLFFKSKWHHNSSRIRS